MTQTRTTAPRQRPPDFMYKIINPTFRVLLRTPLHGLLSNRLMLLSFTGRKSGKSYTVPVAYVQDGNSVLVTTQSRWAKNLRGGVPVKLRLRGQDRTGVANLIDDEEGMRAAYHIMLTHSPELGQIIGVTVEPDGAPNAADLARARQENYVVIRIQLS